MNYSHIKSFDDFVSVVKRLCLLFSIVFFCLHIWKSFISPSSEYSDLTEIEGVIVEKSLNKGYRSSEAYYFKIIADDGVKQLWVISALVSECCFLSEVPLNETVSVLTDGDKLYQLTYDNKVLLDARDVITREEESKAKFILISLLLLLGGVLAYFVELVRKARKNV